MQERRNLDPPTLSPRELYNELVRRRAERPNLQSCLMLVEGPDDARALKKLRDPACIIEHRGTRKGVLMTMDKILSISPNAAAGVVGIIDRDFDHFRGEPEPLGCRTAWLSHRCNDLESAVLRVHGASILEELTSDVGRRNDAWLHDPPRGSPLDALVLSVAAPIGRLRAAYCSVEERDYRRSVHPIVERWESLEPKDINERPMSRLPDSLLDLLKVPAQPSNAQLLEIIPQSVDNRVHARVAEELEGLDHGDDPWAFVRGKDLVRSIAYALYASPRSSMFRKMPIHALEKHIGDLVVGKFDADAAHEAAVHDSIEKASAGDATTYPYLKRRTG